MTKPTLSYEAEGLCLRPLRHDDLEYTLAWRNREGVRQCFLYSELITPQQHLHWFEQYLLKPDDCVLIAEMQTGGRIGQLALYDIDLQKRTAEVGRFIASPEYAGRGMMRKAIEALFIIAANSLGLETLYLEVLPTNTRALELYRQLGFVAEISETSVVKMTKTLD